MNQSHFVDLCFPLKGESIPADSAYQVYSALSHLITDIHHNPQIGIMPINGQLEKAKRRLKLTSKSRLVLRLPQTEIVQYLSLAGQRLVIGNETVQLQGGFLQPLVPSAQLYSRLVTLKGKMEPESFYESAQRAFKELGIQGEISLVTQAHIQTANQAQAKGSHSGVLRRTVQIKNNQIIGFALRANQLNSLDSLTLQEKGLGGRRHFGCGLFIPAQV
ncbi:MAG: type I-MYXAN CRISPR-associated protein Cas6/Cmx6 [Candidatus Sericytochromatia bacterium]